MKWIPLAVAAAFFTGCNADFNWVHYEPQAQVGEPEVCADFTSELRILDRMGQQTDTFIQREPIRFELHVTNNGPVGHTLFTPFGGGQAWIVVVDQRGRIVTPVCRNCAFTQAPEPFPYGPGETMVHALDWNQVMDNGKQAPVGDYTVHADDRTECRVTLSKSSTLRIR